MANDFVLSEGGASVHLLKTDIHNWNITFVDTGLHAKIGERLRAVRHLLGDDEMFLANYGDTLTDADLPAMIERAKAAGVDGQLPRGPAELQLPRRLDGRRRVRRRRQRRHALRHLDQRRLLRLASEILDELAPGEDLVEEPFQRLMPDGQAARAAPRRLLGADGHAQGQAERSRALHESGARAVAAVETDRGRAHGVAHAVAA